MQPAHRRLVIAGGILAVGGTASLPFYHGKSKDLPAAPANVQPDHPAVAVPLQIPGVENESPASETGATPPAEPIVKRVGTKPKPDPALPTPQLPVRHPSANEQVPPATTIQRKLETVHQSAPEVNTEVPAAKPPRIHRITDGDTLEHLAKRFLGDAARWPEIRDANRDVLVADDILPIGKELRIPPRATSTQDPFQVPSDSETSTPEKSEPTADRTLAPGLVPIPWGGNSHSK